MLLAFLVALGPIALYLLLAALPPRLARRGLWTAGTLLGLLWLSWPLGLPPFFASGAMEDAFMAVALTIWTLAALVAGLVQGARPWLSARGRLAYPLAALGALVLILLGVLPLVGVA